MAAYCSINPKAANGKESKLFKDLVRNTNDREAAKTIWAFTQTTLFKSEFNDVIRDENGEPTYDSIAEILDLDSILSRSTKDRALALERGLMHEDGSPVEIDSPNIALQKTEAYNDEAQTKVANVYKKENGKYEIRVEARSPENLSYAINNKFNRRLNVKLISFLNDLGFDIQFVDKPGYQGIFDPLNATENANGLKNIIRVSKDEIGTNTVSKEICHVIIAGLEGTQLKSRLDAIVNDDVIRQVLGDKYERYKNAYQNDSVPVEEQLRDEAEGELLFRLLQGEQITPQSISLVKRLWLQAKSKFGKANEADIDTLVSAAYSELRDVSTMLDKKTLIPVLDKERIMAHQRLYELNDDLSKMQDIAFEAEALLAKKLSILQNTKNKERNEADANARAALRGSIQNIRMQIQDNNYVNACLIALNQITSDMRMVMMKSDYLSNVNMEKADLKTIAEESERVREMKAIVMAYKPFLLILQRLPKLKRQGQIDISFEEAENISKLASDTLRSVDDIQADLRDARFAVLRQLVSLFYGDGGRVDGPEGKARMDSIDMLLRQAERDIAFYDTGIFSAGDSRNPLINVLHNIVVRTQARRDSKIFRLVAKIQEAQANLQKTGISNDFIYQRDAEGNTTGYYVADVDMYAFEKAREQHVEIAKQLHANDPYALRRAIEDWDRKNTEELEITLDDGTKYVQTIPNRKIYENKDFQKGWNQAQKDYYQAIIDMKAEMDAILPSSAQHLYNAPQTRRSVTQMFDKDGPGAVKTVLSNLKKEWSVVDDNPDYGKNVAEKTPEGDYVILTDFDGKPLKRVPVYFIHKLENLKDMSTDGTRAMMAYIAMAVNYSEMNQLSDAMQLMQDHLKEDYEVGQTFAGKIVKDVFPALGETYSKIHTKKGMETNVVEQGVRYIDRLFFNERKNVMGDVKIPFTDKKLFNLDSAFNVLLKLTSVSRMGLNPLSGLSNASQGESQMMIEATRKRYFDYKDLAKAKLQYGKLIPEYLVNFNAIDRHDKLALLIAQFNPEEDFFRDIQNRDFNSEAYKRVIGKGNIYFMNAIGEHYLHTTGLISMMYHEKVKRTYKNESGKEITENISLYDALEQVHDKDGWRLEIKGKIEFEDKDKPYLRHFGFKTGEKAIFDKDNQDALFESFGIYARNINNGMHGGYSDAERGNENQKAIWRAILQFRQWMPGMYNKLYSRPYYDAAMGEMREGAYYTLLKTTGGFIHDWINTSLKYAIENRNLTENEKANIRVALGQTALFVALITLSAMTRGFKDDDDAFKRLLAYNILRLKLETGALHPIGLPENILTLIQSPAASMDTIETMVKLFDMPNYWTEIQSGRYKGWTKAAKAFYTLMPFYSMQKLIDMKNYNYMFNIFN